MKIKDMPNGAKKTSLLDRAELVNLDENATEAQVIAAEKKAGEKKTGDKNTFWLARVAFQYIRNGLGARLKETKFLVVQSADEEGAQEAATDEIKKQYGLEKINPGTLPPLEVPRAEVRPLTPKEVVAWEGSKEIPGF